MIINVEFGISQYTAEELVNYDVYCGDYCLSELIDKIVDKDRQTAVKAEKALGEYATKYHKQWAMKFYD